ncbi:adenosine deaminase [Paractinoplanes toevensis]|uniref:Adenosine/adenine deaminase n=1 Tax=Paractinoplanes toevensis TaxID=571911 RepID=A0A919W0Y4_9ACTN|nr:adenosine deaminase [Actinoplanes toevensis]GIM89779.1 putative adenosine/adenine deaminase [Actinoplanes toevensis]
MRDLRALPKAHLHIHLEATMRPATMAEFSGRPARSSFEYTGFTEFVTAYYGLTTLLDSPARLARLIEEAVEDAAADGVVAIELATTPSWYTPVFGSLDAAIEALCGFAADAAAKHGVWTGVIVAIDRTAGPDAALELASAAARHAGRGVVGLGLHAEERGFPARDFQKAFVTARDAGLLAVPHAGELVGPESVREAVTLLGADRVQHGVRSVEDPALVAELAATGTVLDVCPTSNLLLGVVPSLAAHPLPALLAAGVRCSINADDPTLFGVGVRHEYEVARHDLGLDDTLLAACARTSVQASAAPATVKETALAAIDLWPPSPA